MEHRASLLSSRTVAGTNVYSPLGQKIGTLRELLIDPLSGRVKFALVRSEFENLENDWLPLPWRTLRYARGLEGFHTFATEVQLRAASQFSEEDAGTEEWETKLKAHYDVVGD